MYGSLKLLRSVINPECEANLRWASQWLSLPGWTEAVTIFTSLPIILTDEQFKGCCRAPTDSTCRRVTGDKSELKVDYFVFDPVSDQEVTASGQRAHFQKGNGGQNHGLRPSS